MRKAKNVPREKVLGLIQEAVAKAGGQWVTFNEFVEGSGMRPKDVYQHFTGWPEALHAAGCYPEPRRAPIATEKLLEDYGTVARKLGRAPTRRDYIVEGKYGVATMALRFKGWKKLCDAFLAFAKKNEGWEDVAQWCKELPIGRRRSEKPGSRLPVRGLKLNRPAALQLKGRQKPGSGAWYGELLDFEALQHAPVNEQGVVFLFGMLAGRLGFVVDGLRPGFPDCEARRQVDRGRWERVRIEFEYESRNFQDHRHPEDGCDLIVCWRDNWPGCPVETIELSAVVSQMRSTGS
ncbi:MAG TPA: hypothetical protein VG733_19665 [Chthoniobacteraceae bacterium]|nr:hypothetical protein [Chthoniobacteraceae bacterium]